MKFPRLERRTVIVTGCSTGIGAATAIRLRDRGWTVMPTARKDADLERLAAEGFHPLRLDVADSASVQRAAAEAIAHFDGGPGAVVNNAGYGQSGAVEDMSRDAMRRQFEVNVFGMQEFTNAFIPAFREQGYGRIVNISSVLGLVSLPMIGVYSALKFAMEALSDALRIEVQDTGVAVSLVEPGPIETEFGANSAAQAERALPMEEGRFAELYRREIRERKTGERRLRPFTLPPDAVAAKIQHALESARPRRRYCVTLQAYGGAFLRRAAPGVILDRVALHSFRRRLRSQSD